MKILITGVYGIVGSYLCEKLRKEHEIIGVGRRKEYYNCDKYYSCDITDKDALKEIISKNKDLNIIIHCAALAHNKGNDLSKDRFMKVNYEASKYLIDLSNEMLNLKNFIFISTISVYGETIDKDIYEEDDICNPRSPYALAKRKSEEYIQNNCDSNFTILRLSPVYSNDFMLNINRRTCIKGVKYRVGNGKQKLSLCNIKNIYLAVNYIIKNSNTELNEIYNISDLDEYEFNELIYITNKSLLLIIPKFLINVLRLINKFTLKNQFIHENSIKLLTNNIYSSMKINKKIRMKFNLEDLK